MNHLLEEFRLYLQKADSSPTKITVKNYVSDIGKYIRWYETFYADSFFDEYHSFLLEAYSNYLEAHDIPTLSVKRYYSSLRKFYDFLEEKYELQNPFRENKQENSDDKDLHLNEYRDYLFVFGSAELTAKNYIIDLRLFREWLQSEYNFTLSNLFPYLKDEIITKYKHYLLEREHLSIGNTNRKISSLRKYRSFGYAYGYIKRVSPRPSIYSITSSHLRQYLQVRSYSITYSTYLMIAVLSFCLMVIGSYELYGSKHEDSRTYATYATPPRIILTLQGKLTDYKNNLITKPTDLYIGLYTKNPSDKAAVLLWEEMQYAVVPTTTGNIFLKVGLTKPLPEDIFKNRESLYMAITINAGSNLKEKTIVYQVNKDMLRTL